MIMIYQTMAFSYVAEICTSITKHVKSVCKEHVQLNGITPNGAISLVKCTQKMLSVWGFLQVLDRAKLMILHLIYVSKNSSQGGRREEKRAIITINSSLFWLALHCKRQHLNNANEAGCLIFFQSSFKTILFSSFSLQLYSLLMSHDYYWRVCSAWLTTKQ